MAWQTEGDFRHTGQKTVDVYVVASLCARCLKHCRASRGRRFGSALIGLAGGAGVAAMAWPYLGDWSWAAILGLFASMPIVVALNRTLFKHSKAPPTCSEGFPSSVLELQAAQPLVTAQRKTIQVGFFRPELAAEFAELNGVATLMPKKDST